MYDLACALWQEYVLAMATSDVASRPKGGRVEYRNGPHAKPSLHGKKCTLTSRKYGVGAYADSPFRYRGIAEQVLAIR